MAYDFGDCAHKTHGEALLARACLQTSRAWASSGGGGAGQYRLCARPSLGARDIYAGSGEGLRKSLMSWSSEGGLGLGCEAAANSLVFSKILVFQRLLENSLLPAS